MKHYSHILFAVVATAFSTPAMSDGFLVEGPKEASMGFSNGTQFITPTVAYKLSSEILDIVHDYTFQDESILIRAATIKGASSYGPVSFLRTSDAARSLLTYVDDGSGRGTIWLRVDADSIANVVLSLASHPDVIWIERYRIPVPMNDNSSWLIQSGSEALGQSVWQKGLTGWGQIVGVADTGLDIDACHFRYGVDRSTVTTAIDTHQPPEAIQSAPLNKLITYYVVGPAEAYDDATAGYHGTHTTGCVAGDDYENLASETNAGHDTQDGMAPGAKIVFQDFGASNGILSGFIGVTMYDILKQAYDTGVRIHNNSYGNYVDPNTGLGIVYDSDSSSIDSAAWEMNDLVVVFSSGNTGMDANGNPRGETLSGTGSTAKNTIVVGASGPVEIDMFGTTYHMEDDLIILSSQGPTADGRIKPDIVAPGTVFSATTDVSAAIYLGCCDVYGSTMFSSNVDDNNCNVDPDGSMTITTSFSAPVVSGAALLVRQYYTDGFWFSGKSDKSNGFNPTNALVKASLINGATSLSGGITGGGNTFSLTQPPSFEQGWGRVNLENVLFFEGDERRTVLLNDTPNPVPTNPMIHGVPAPYPYALPALETDDETIWQLPFCKQDGLLKITLAWADPPAAPGAESTLINDLDLKVVSPSGDTYFGNKEYDEFGHSQPTSNMNTDTINNVEQITIVNPQNGSYQVSVGGKAVRGNGSEGSTSQGYAVLTTCEFLSPVPESISPARGMPGEQLTNVQVTGSHFVEGMELELGSGISVENVEVIDGQNAVIGSLVIDSMAEHGPRDVVAILHRTLRGVGEGLFGVGVDVSDGGDESDGKSGDDGGSADDGGVSADGGDHSAGDKGDGCGCGPKRGQLGFSFIVMLVLLGILRSIYRQCL